MPIVDPLTSAPDVAPGHRILVRDEFIRGPLGGQPNPASTLVQMAALFRPGLLVEVDAVVAVPG